MEQKQRRKCKRRAFAAAFPYTIPVLTGFLVLGIAYGVLMQQKGYGVIWAVLTTAFQPVQAFLLSLLVNARHLFYGISMLGKYRGLGKVRGFLI